MALPVKDGNQTATTLSSVVTGGEHIVAHTVVSLGATAIANIASAVSGVPIAGTVTVGAIVGPAGGSCLKAISPSGDAVRSLLFTKDSGSTYGELSGSGQGIFNLPVYGTITVGNSVTIGSFATSVTARLINPAGTAVTYAEVGTAGNPSIDVLLCLS